MTLAFKCLREFYLHITGAVVPLVIFQPRLLVTNPSDCGASHSEVICHLLVICALHMQFPLHGMRTTSPSFLLPSLQPPGSLPSFPILGQIPPLKTSPIPLERPRASISGDPLALCTTMIAIGWVYNKCIVMCLSPPITLVSIYRVFPWNRYYTNFGPMFSLDHQSNSAKWPFFFFLGSMQNFLNGDPNCSPCSGSYLGGRAVRDLEERSYFSAQ